MTNGPFNSWYQRVDDLTIVRNDLLSDVVVIKMQLMNKILKAVIVSSEDVSNLIKILEGAMHEMVDINVQIHDIDNQIDKLYE